MTNKTHKVKYKDGVFCFIPMNEINLHDKVDLYESMNEVAIKFGLMKNEIKLNSIFFTKI